MDPPPWSEFLDRCPIVVLATISADGSPHAVPMEVLLRDDRIYFWCRSDSMKVWNMTRDGRVTVTGFIGDLFAMVRGRARVIGRDDSRYDSLADGFLRKYNRGEVYGNNTFIEVVAERFVHRSSR